MSNTDQMIAMRTALALDREARKAARVASATTVGPYSIKADTPPGVGWVLRGPKGTKDNPMSQVLKYYATREMAITAAEALLATPASPKGKTL